MIMQKDLLAIRDECIKNTKKKIKESVSTDLLVGQCINSIQEINKVSNTLIKRLREWYAYYNPEFEKNIASHEKFTELILEKNRKDLLKEAGYSENDSMGADIKKEDLDQIFDMAKRLKSLYELRDEQEKYVINLMKTNYPNITAIAGPTLAAQLLESAKGIKRLALFPSSTVQILGAEKALFRHLKTGADPPKYGILHEHPIIAKMPFEKKGRAARVIADKLAIAAKIDFFKGEFIGDKLRIEIEKKLEIAKSNWDNVSNNIRIIQKDNERDDYGNYRKKENYRENKQENRYGKRYDNKPKKDNFKENRYGSSSDNRGLNKENKPYFQRNENRQSYSEEKSQPRQDNYGYDDYRQNDRNLPTKRVFKDESRYTDRKFEQTLSFNKKPYAQRNENRESHSNVNRYESSNKREFSRDNKPYFQRKDNIQTFREDKNKLRFRNKERPREENFRQNNIKKENYKPRENSFRQNNNRRETAESQGRGEKTGTATWKKPDNENRFGKFGKKQEGTDKIFGREEKSKKFTKGRFKK